MDTYTFGRVLLNLGPKNNRRPGLVPELKKITDFLDDPYPRKFLAGPRGLGKTTLLHAYVTRQLCENRNRSFLLCGHDISLPIRSVNAIRGYLTSSRVKRLFGDLRGEPWRDEFFTVAGVTEPLAAHSIDVFSPERKQVGGHWDELIFDNLQDWDNTDTIENIEMLAEYYRQTTSLLTRKEDRRVMIIENIWHHYDLGCRILGDKMEEARETLEPVMCASEFGEFKCLVLPSYAENSERPLDILRLNFPFNLSKEALEFEYQGMTDAMWATQMQLRASANTNAPFREEFYKVWQADKLPEELLIYIPIDDAQKVKSTSDFSCFHAWGVAQDNRAYQLEFFMGRVPLGNLCARAVTCAISLEEQRPGWKVMAFGTEQTPNKLYLDNILQTEMRERGRSWRIQELKHESSDKLDRSLPAQVKYENGWFYFHPNRLPMKKALLDFPRGRHDDAVDPFTYFVAQMAKWRVPDAKPGSEEDRSAKLNEMLKGDWGRWVEKIVDADDDAAEQEQYKVLPNHVLGGWFPK